jgi:cyanate permease
MNSVASLGAFLSPVLVGKLLQHGSSWTHILCGGALLNVIAALLWLFVRPPSQNGAASPVAAMAIK